MEIFNSQHFDFGLKLKSQSLLIHSHSNILSHYISSIVNEAIGAIYLFYYKDILHKKTYKLCLNISIRLEA